MNFIKTIFYFFYVALVLLISVVGIAFAFRFFSVNELGELFRLVQSNQELRLIFGALASFVGLTTFVVYFKFRSGMKEDKVIAFDNPSGRVSVSLSALEDLVRRMLIRLVEIRDVSANITVAKDGLKVIIRLVLGSEVSVPEISSNIQKSVIKKIQATIGVDEQIDVAVYVTKIIAENVKDKSIAGSAASDEGQDPTVPFHGYRP